MNTIEIYVLPHNFENNKLVLTKLGKIFDIKTTYLNLAMSLLEIYEDIKAHKYSDKSYELFTYSILEKDDASLNTICNKLFKDDDVSLIPKIHINTIASDGVIVPLKDYINYESSLDYNNLPVVTEDMCNSLDLIDNIRTEVLINSYGVLNSDYLNRLFKEDNKIIDFYDLITKYMIPSYNYIGKVYKIEFDNTDASKRIGFNDSGIHTIERFTSQDDFDYIKSLFRKFKLRIEDVQDINDVYIQNAGIENFAFYTQNSYIFKFSLNKNKEIKIKIKNLITDSASF